MPPNPPKPDTQAGRLLAALQSGPVCSFQLYDRGSPFTHRVAARVYDLRQRGYVIDSSPCRSHSHDAAAVEYRLARVGQLVFP